MPRLSLGTEDKSKGPFEESEFKATGEDLTALFYLNRNERENANAPCQKIKVNLELFYISKKKNSLI